MQTRLSVAVHQVSSDSWRFLITQLSCTSWLSEETSFLGFLTMVTCMQIHTDFSSQPKCCFVRLTLRFSFSRVHDLHNPLIYHALSIHVLKCSGPCRGSSFMNDFLVLVHLLAPSVRMSEVIGCHQSSELSFFQSLVQPATTWVLYICYHWDNCLLVHVNFGYLVFWTERVIGFFRVILLWTTIRHDQFERKTCPRGTIVVTSLVKISIG